MSKKIEPGFFKKLSWDNLSVQPMGNVKFEVPYNQKNKLSHNSWGDADGVAKAFMPVRNQYVEGYKDFINTMPEDWFNKNRGQIEANLKLDNPEYINKNDWGFELYKKGLMDGKLGPMHRMWFNTLMQGQEPGTGADSGTEPALETIPEPKKDNWEVGHRIPDKNLINYLKSNKSADDILNVNLTSPVVRNPLAKEPQLRTVYQAPPKEIDEAKANIVKAATKGSSDNNHFAKLLAASSNVTDAHIKHNQQQNSFIEKQRSNYQDRKLKTDQFNLTTIQGNNTNIANKRIRDIAAISLNLQTKNQNYQNYLKAVTNKEEAENSLLNLKKYNTLATELGDLNDLNYKITAGDFVDDVRKQFDTEYENVDMTDEERATKFQEKLKAKQGEYLKGRGFESLEHFEQKRKYLNSRLAGYAFYMQSNPKHFILPEHSKGGVLKFLKNGGKNPDVNRYEAQVKNEIKSIEQLYKLISSQNSQLIKSLNTIEKEMYKLNKTK